MNIGTIITKLHTFVAFCDMSKILTKTKLDSFVQFCG